jgi:alpha-glucosidase (family GH31 glycosyl hydrolase)
MKLKLTASLALVGLFISTNSAQADEWKYETFENPLAMFPKKAFGYWAYEETPEVHQKNIIPFIQEWKDRDIPLSGIVLEPLWQQDYNDLLWNENYPEPEKMIQQMNAMGISIGLWENGWLNANCANWEEAVENNYLVPEESRNWVGSIREAKQIDTRKPEVIDWWMEQHHYLLDMNVITFKLDAGLSPKGNNKSLYLAEPFAKKAEEYANKRIFALKCWGGWARDEAEVATGLWIGDPLPYWQACSDTLLMGIINGLNGQWFFAPEIGALDGRRGNATSPELFIRWAQWGMCAPHPSAMGGNSGHWPWKYGKDSEDSFRIYAKWRMRLMPYIYSYSWNTYQTNEPLMRAMAIDFPNDPKVDFAYNRVNPFTLLGRHNQGEQTHDFIDIGDGKKQPIGLYGSPEEHQFMFGREILVAPVVWEGLTSRDVYLPAGTEWIDYRDGKTVYQGGQTLKNYPAALLEMPRFVKAGSIIPMGPDMLYVDEKPLDQLTLDIYPSKDTAAEFTLYEDDGVSLGYRNGKHAITQLSCSPADGRQLAVNISAAEGTYNGMVDFREYTLKIHRQTAKPSSVKTAGVTLNPTDNLDEVSKGWHYDAADQILYVKYGFKTSVAADTSILF